MNILYLGVGFVKYDTAIVSELTKGYDNVYYINLKWYQQTHNKICSLFEKLNKHSVIESFCQKNILEQLERIKDIRIDRIFVIKGEYLNDFILDRITDYYPYAEKILYLWDAFVNHKNQDVLIRHFDNIYSFDILDCERLGFCYRPLFYTKKAIYTDKQHSIDVSFIGVGHINRVNLFRLLYNGCKEHQIVASVNVVIGIYNYIKGIINKEVLFTDIRFLKMKSIPYDRYLEITSSSKAVFDIPAFNQSGLTMRSIEALAVEGCKLITTNKFIYKHNRAFQLKF